MARRLVKVTPVIGLASTDRLGSMTGCHALHERAVTRSFTTADSIGAAIEDALHEIALCEAAVHKTRRIDDQSYLVNFIID